MRWSCNNLLLDNVQSRICRSHYFLLSYWIIETVYVCDWSAGDQVYTRVGVTFSIILGSY